MGRLPSEVETTVEINGVAPTLTVRDQLQEAQRFQLENAAGILSPQTWSQRLGLDYGQEQAAFRRACGRDACSIQSPKKSIKRRCRLDASAAKLSGVAENQG